MLNEWDYYVNSINGLKLFYSEIHWNWEWKELPVVGSNVNITKRIGGAEKLTAQCTS